MSDNRPAILALDASTEACTVALELGEGRWSRFAVRPRGHARDLLAMIEAVLVEAGLERRHIGLVTYGRGPGAFTGVRISVGVAQGLACGLDVPVAGVSTLAAVAQGSWRRQGAERVLAALDARMNEVYWAACAHDADSGLMLPLGEEAVGPASAVALPERWQDYLGAGTGWQSHGEVLTATLGVTPREVEADALPDALDLLPFGRHARKIGQVVAADEAAPLYLRNKVTG
ncbi:MAG: tRNA (adenosine(37)-N6)-threonylcarbamoyltransferase complex dimerization subunit type 1 TsaB [Aquisalimonadaceae bacterium]